MPERSLTRRQSLLGIGAASTVLGGAGLGFSNALAGDEERKDDEKKPDEKGDESKSDETESKAKDDENEDDETKGGVELELVCHEKPKAKFRVHNERSEAVKVNWKVRSDRIDLDDDDLDDLDDFLDDLDEDDLDDLDEDDLDDLDEDDLDGTIADLDEDDLDDLDDDDLDDLRDYLEGVAGDRKVDSVAGKLTVPKGDTEEFWAAVITKDAAVDLYYDGKKVDSVDVEKKECEKATKADEIDLEAVCYRDREVDFGDLDDHTYDNALDNDVSGVDEDFDPDGEVIVGGEEVDEDDLDDLDDDDFDDDFLEDNEFDDVDDLEGIRGTSTVREAKFRVHNRGKEEVKVGWTVESDGQGGKLRVDAKDSASFWVTAVADQKTSVSVTYDGEVIDTQKADTETRCNDEDRDDDGDQDEDDD